MDDDTKYNGDELENPEDTERREEAEETDGVNDPDEAFTDDDELDENQRVRDDAGDNLTQQHPTQDQTAGESGVSGVDDEEYTLEEETDQDDDTRER